MPSDTKVIPHEWVEFRMTRVARVDDEFEGAIFIPNGLDEPEVTYGCRVCDMGINEASGVSCPGPIFREE